MLTISWETVRLFLHVLAACVWVGGQLTLAGLVPALRRFGHEVTQSAARAFNLVAWPAFAVLVATGVWNIVATNTEHKGDTQYQTTLMIKMTVVVISGLAAFLHTRAKSKMSLAVFGALTGLSALAALFLGVLLAQ
jgi:putative copper export protein